MSGNQVGRRMVDGGKSKNNMSTPQWGGHNYSKNKLVALIQQTISACERALCQLTVCFEFQSRSQRRKGHKSCALQLVLRSKVQR